MVRGLRRVLGGGDDLGHTPLNRTDRPSGRAVSTSRPVVGLHGPFPMPEAPTLAEIRAVEPSVLLVRQEIDGAHAGSIYYPFQLRADGIRSAQSYLSKMPKELVAA